ncbi:MAG: hypothetical protein ABI905_13150 [Betaproteobacteria bacterium]
MDMSQKTLVTENQLAEAWWLCLRSGLIVFAVAVSFICGAQEQTGGHSLPSVRDASIWGHERSVPGLAKLIELRDLRLMDQYRHDFLIANMAIYRANDSKPYSLPEGVEELIIKNYLDPVIGASLRSLLSADGLQYHSRTLFDLMYADYDNWQSDRVRNQSIPVSSSITHTDLKGIEAPLLQVLKRERKPELLNDYVALMRFLATRNYAPLKPELIRILRDASADDPLAQVCIITLRGLDPVAAAETAAHRLTRLGTRAFTPNPYSDVDDLISAIAYAPTREVGNIEPEVLEWFKAARSAKVRVDISRLIDFLVKRNYQPTLPVLLGLVRENAPDEKLMQVFFSGLLRLDAETASIAAIERLGILRAQAGESRVSNEIDWLLGFLSRIPLTTRVNLDAVEALLPESFGEFGYYHVNRLYTARKDARIVAISQRVLSDARHLSPAVTTILEFGSPEAWQQARQEIESLQKAGKLTDAQTHHVLAELNTHLADPPKYIAERRLKARRQQFSEKLSVLQSAKNAGQQEKGRSPEQYIKSALESADGFARLTAEFNDLPESKNQQDEIARQYLSAGNVARFSLRQPARALEYFAKAEAHGLGLATLAAADTYQFDLHDKARAIIEYQRMLDRKPEFNSSNDVEVSLMNWGRKWLGHQIEFLKTGKIFAGPINQDDIAGLGTYLYFGAGFTAVPLDPFGLAALSRPNIDPASQVMIGPPIIDRSAVGRKLPTLPASIFVLAQTFEQYALLPDAESILRHLDRHDPAGFASACLLGMAILMDRQNADRQKAGLNAWPQIANGQTTALLAAAELFSKKRKISLRQETDPRLAHPEKTWNLLIASLKTGDLDTAMTCLTPNMQSRFRPVFAKMTKDALREMADSFTGFAGGGSLGENMYEAYATRGTLAGSIQFVRENGMWRIAEM